VNLPRPEICYVPKLFETAVPMAGTSDSYLLNSLQQQKPWSWVKLAQQDANRGHFSVFEKVSEEEIERARANYDFYHV
jgi:hypothetical protein